MYLWFCFLKIIVFKSIVLYGGIFRTYIVLLFISCARLFYFVDRFFFSIISCARLFLFRRSFFLFYYLVRTTFYIWYVVFFFSTISCARLFFACRFFSFLLSRENHLLIYFLVKSYIHTRQPTNPRQMPTNFYGLVGYDGVKNYSLLLKSVYIPDQQPLYPRCIPDAPTLKSRSSRPTPSFRLTNSRSSRPTPTYSWYNYAHYAQYRTNPRSVCLVSITGLKWIIKANVMSTDILMRVQHPICTYGPYKSYFKSCIYHRGVDRGYASPPPAPCLPPPISERRAKLSSFHIPPFFSLLSELRPPLLPPPSPSSPSSQPLLQPLISPSRPSSPPPSCPVRPLILVEVSFYICNSSVENKDSF